MQQEVLISLLKSEVKPAVGCTEPAAVGLAAAKAAKLIGGQIDKLIISASANIVKNAMAVTIPNTQEAGVGLAAALGMIQGDPAKGLELFETVVKEDVVKAKQLMARGAVEVNVAQENGFYISARAEGINGWAEVYIAGGHTNIVREMINGETVFEKDAWMLQPQRYDAIDITKYKLADLISTIEAVSTDDLEFLHDGITMNLNVSAKGLELTPGLGVGSGIKALLTAGVISDDIITQARIQVAAACDARMAGISIPVMSAAGSGNQGIGTIIPVAVVAAELKSSRETLLRALAISHIITIYVKQHIGKLSSLCGCSVAAGSGATAAIAWLYGGQSKQIEGAIQNMIGNLAGTVCDGAKGGCALKLATSASEAIFAAQLAVNGIIISQQDGIIGSTVEETIRNLGQLSMPGMAATGNTILSIMMEKERQADGNPCTLS